MNWVEIIKRFYPKHWTKEMVKDAVVAEKISAEQYLEIVGEEYEG